MGEREKERDGRVKGGEEGGFNESDRAVTRDVQRRETVRNPMHHRSSCAQGDSRNMVEVS
jgi:hypothetical protein